MGRRTDIAVIDIRATTTPAVGARLRWRGALVEVVDVARLSPEHTQVVLRIVGRRAGLPVSVPAADLADAETLS